MRYDPTAQPAVIDPVLTNEAAQIFKKVVGDRSPLGTPRPLEGDPHGWVSFTRHFYKPPPLRTLEEISADILWCRPVSSSS